MVVITKMEGLCKNTVKLHLAELSGVFLSLQHLHVTAMTWELPLKDIMNMANLPEYYSTPKTLPSAHQP